MTLTVLSTGDLDLRELPLETDTNPAWRYLDSDSMDLSALSADDQALRVILPPGTPAILTHEQAAIRVPVVAARRTRLRRLTAAATLLTMLIIITAAYDVALLLLVNK